MGERKIKIRAFTIADFREEEAWLREQHKAGWKLVKACVCVYTFEKCDPEDVIYRLEFTNDQEKPEYMQMVRDYGWEYTAKTNGWLYFRKPAAETENENDGELFSDLASKEEQITKIARQRLLPIGIIFLLIVIPNTVRSLKGEETAALAVIWCVLLAVYVYILVHSALRFRKLRKELNR